MTGMRKFRRCVREHDMSESRLDCGATEQVGHRVEGARD